MHDDNATFASTTPPCRPRRRAPFGLAAMAALLLAGLPAPATLHAQAAAGKPPPAAVEVAQVKAGTVLRTVQAVGSMIANESVVIRPEEAGRINELGFDEGQPVAADTLLFALDDSIYRAELAQARATYSLNVAEYKRAEELLERRAGSITDRDQALSRMRVSEASVALAEARLAKMTIEAPFDGVMGLRNVGVGDFVQAGDALVSITDIDPIKVDFRVPEVFLKSVSVGQRLTVTADALPGERFEGEVYAIDPQLDVNGRAIVVRARAANEDGRLRPGLFARVDLIVDRREDALTIPEQALMPSGDRQFVFKVVDGKAVNTEVVTGLRRGSEVEVVQGLADGDTVVTAGQLKLRDGTEVAPRAADAGGG